MRCAQLLVVAGVGALAVAMPAQAGFGPADLDNDYEGRAERDPFTYVGFDVANEKIAKVTASLQYTCDNGEGGRTRAKVRGKLPLDGNRFAGTLKVVKRPIQSRGGSAPGTIKYRIDGKLKGKRRAKGRIDAEIRFTPTKMRGTDRVRCYSGRVDWKARRGADLDVEGPLR